MAGIEAGGIGSVSDPFRIREIFQPCVSHMDAAFAGCARLGDPRVIHVGSTGDRTDMRRAQRVRDAGLPDASRDLNRSPRRAGA